MKVYFYYELQNYYEKILWEFMFWFYDKFCFIIIMLIEYYTARRNATI